MLFYGKAKENSRHLKFLIHVRFSDLQQRVMVKISANA